MDGASNRWKGNSNASRINLLRAQRLYTKYELLKFACAVVCMAVALSFRISFAVLALSRKQLLVLNNMLLGVAISIFLPINHCYWSFFSINLCPSWSRDSQRVAAPFSLNGLSLYTSSTRCCTSCECCVTIKCGCHVATAVVCRSFMYFRE